MMLVGVVSEVVYTNPDNGYTVATLETTSGEVTIVGTLPPIGDGERIQVEGAYTVHQTYGRQFNVTSFSSFMPIDETAMLRYLSSGIVKGVKAATAKNLINAFGPETLDVIENEPEKLATVKGISPERARRISESLRANNGIKSLLLGFQQYGLTPTVAFKIYKKWGASSYEIMRTNPYRLCEIEGIGFEKADKIAKQMEFDTASPFRTSAGIIYVLTHNLNSNGHTFQPMEKLCEIASGLLGIEYEEAERVTREMIDKAQLVYVPKIANTNGVYLRRAYECEKNIAERVVLASKFEHEYPGDFEADIKSAEASLEISFAQNQRAAIKNSVCYNIMVLTGGPGTGKTTTLMGIIYNLELKGLTFTLAAPTGRAAKRMTELTGKDAKTLHRLLEYTPKGDSSGFARNKSNPLKYDVVIVDESSMIDLHLFSALLDALPASTRLILVGDANQLPPVGPGSVFKDIIASGAVHVTELNEIFRQSGESLIVMNAHEIINGAMPELRDRKKDFFYLPALTPEELLMTVSDLYMTRLPNAYNYNPVTDIQIISPTRKTRCGTVSINAMLREVANPKKYLTREYQYRDTVFREGDKVMQTKNNYDLTVHRDSGEEEQGVFNGDIGIIEQINEYEESVTVRYDDKRVTYLPENLDDLDLAYAITVHKSQGSEWKAVILPLLEGSDILFTRNLLYTAVTRAKQLLIIVGSYIRVAEMVDNKTSDKRYSGVKYMIRDAQ